MANKQWNIVGLGEVLWDVFPDGPRFGGAPANFACCAAQLLNDYGCVRMVSGVGNDRLGQEAIEKLRERGVEPSFVPMKVEPTGQVFVTLDETGNASYRFLEDCAWDKLSWSEALSTLAAQTDVVCFGTLGQRDPISRSMIRRFVDSVPQTALKILDINLRAPYWNNELILDSLSRCNILKLNEDELPVLASLLKMDGTPESILRRIRGQFSLHLVAYTRGENGSILVTDIIDEKPSHKVNVVDTVGAGDAFTAALVAGLLEFQSYDGSTFSISSDRILSQIHEKCVRVAGIVASSSGATPALPKSLGVSQ